MNIKASTAPLVIAITIAGPMACGDDTNDDELAAAGSTSQSETGTPNETTTGETPQPDDAETDATTDDADGTGAIDETGEDGTTGPDPYADCDRATLAADFGVVDPMGTPGAIRWYGPGADPKTGELLDDGETTYFVTATYLALQPDAFPAFLELNPPINEALFGNPGMVATQLGASFECNAARTLTVWADEASMTQFVTSDAHMAAVVAFPSLSRGSSTLSVWDELVAPSEITWDEALNRIDAEQPYD